MGNLLTVKDLNLSYGERNVVTNVSFSLEPGEILAVAGESGCGKSSLLRAIIGLKDFGVKITGGGIEFGGVDLSRLGAKRRRELWGTDIGMVFQSPGDSFNPLRTYKKQFAEVLKSHGMFRGEKSYKDIILCFEKLGLPDYESILDNCPYEMSGGMNQRVSIAMAMLLQPKLLLADEPTSALDVTTQKQVIEEMMRLGEMCGMGIIIVTHNLGVAAAMADKLGIMYAGRLVEYGDAADVLASPLHPYTRSLIEAVPDLGGGMPKGLNGRPPIYPEDIPGCAFRERCPLACPECESTSYEMHQAAGNHSACCDRR